MSSRYLIIADILLDIEKELRELNLWAAEGIADEALQSNQPFAVDTMTFPQWLQFVFLPRMYSIVEQQSPLPLNCSIAPMAEYYFSNFNLHSAALIAHLSRIDTTLNSSLN